MHSTHNPTQALWGQTGLRSPRSGPAQRLPDGSTCSANHCCSPNLKEVTPNSASVAVSSVPTPIRLRDRHFAAPASPRSARGRSACAGVTVPGHPQSAWPSTQCLMNEWMEMRAQVLTWQQSASHSDGPNSNFLIPSRSRIVSLVCILRLESLIQVT